MRPLQYLSYFNSLGFNFFFHRAFYEILKRTGIVKAKNPSVTKNNFNISKQTWLTSSGNYIFKNRESLKFPKIENQQLKTNAENTLKGKIKYFNCLHFETTNPKWHKHPVDGYIYSNLKHFSDFNDFNHQRDIKFIWERARFCFIYDIIRYDYHFQKNNSEFLLGEIISFINENPFNCGPHYMSSQEIALRLMNWLFVLHYYAEDAALSDEVFKKIMTSVYNQLEHIYNNLSFSQKFVRNNHVVTEATALFVYAVIFPQLKESGKWLSRSKKILDTEASFQIFNDGTYLQYSMNYHRIIIQLYTLVLRVSALNNIKVNESIYKKLDLSLFFLTANTERISGAVPNYGNNDGSLFFPLNNNEYNDFRPQLQALGNCIGKKYFTENIFEDNYWLNVEEKNMRGEETQLPSGPISFNEGGYYLLREKETFTFIRCGKHKWRPAQADNLHVDIWFEGKNLMADGGSFSYNSEPEIIRYFLGTRSHNTIMLDDYDQMLKGPRFIWLYWTRLIKAELRETATHFYFSGAINAFRQSGAWRTHSREIIKTKNKPEWKIEDTMQKRSNSIMHQIWNPTQYFDERFSITAMDANGYIITPELSEGFLSPAYGAKISIQQIIFSTVTNKIETTITLKA